MDLLKLPPDVLMEVLKWCKKRSLDLADVKALFGIINGTDSPQQEKQLTRRRGPGKKSEEDKKKVHNYRELRNAKGLSIKQAAAKMQMSPMTLQAVEKGKGNPNERTLARIKKFYEVE